MKQNLILSLLLLFSLTSWAQDNDAGITVGEKIDVSGYPYFVIIRPDGVIGSTFLGIGKVHKYFKTFDF